MTELTARVCQLHDTEANWITKNATTPFAGEIIVYDPDKNHNYPRIKIGDGTTSLGKLPFVGEEDLILFCGDASTN